MGLAGFNPSGSNGGVKMVQEVTTQELIACVLSRYVKDGELAAAGANAIVPRAATLLAHLHHGPNMRMFQGGCWHNLFHKPVIQVYSTVDYRQELRAEYLRRHEEGFDRAFYQRKKGAFSHFFFGAIQIDKYGNLNMFGVGEDFRHLKFRGPGIIGLSHVGNFIENFYIYATHHSKRVFVEKLDYVSAIGHGDGPDFRKEWRLPGSGPKLCVSPMAIMDFEEDTKRMRLKSVHPGFTVSEVVENTGFELIIPKDVPFTDSPTENELEILRKRVDPSGLLRK
jgi:glutaconate CoA-transferase subunit B